MKMGKNPRKITKKKKKIMNISKQLDERENVARF